MTSHKVSVITTVYNGEAYFDRAPPSILDHQRMSEFEWVIVDDGSTDRTAELLGELAARDSRVRVLSPGRLGYARALNHGIEAASGVYIANQDFDDTSFPSRLALQAAFLDRHHKVAVVGGRYFLDDEVREERYERRPPEEHAQIVRAMASRIPFAHTVVMFRKEAWRDAGGYPMERDLVDFRLWLEIGRCGWQFANLPEVLGTHYVHARSHFVSTSIYEERQLRLAQLQAKAIQQFELPWWMHVYPTGRYIYCRLPDRLKRASRRLLVGSQELDLAT
jgi:glycosyltransferase EpsE